MFYYAPRIERPPGCGARNIHNHKSVYTFTFMFQYIHVFFLLKYSP